MRKIILLLKIGCRLYSGILLVCLFSFLLINSTYAQPINSFPYLEDFENGNGGWIPGGSGTWTLGTPAKNVINSAASGSNSYITGGLSGQYSPNENSFVRSPEFDFTTLQQPIIQMNVWWNSEFSWDGAVLQSSTNNGGTWQNVGNLNDPNNWYNDNTINGNPGGQQTGWTGAGANGSGGWVQAKNSMNSLIGQSSVLLRIAFGSDASVQDDGFAFDDIVIFDLKAKDLGLLSVSSPTQDCALGAEPVTLRIRNFGFQPQSNFGIAYQINNRAPVRETFTNTLNQDQEATFTFSTLANFSPDSNFVISVWLELVGDENTTNDSLMNRGIKTILPISPVSFDGYDGSNLSTILPSWREASGITPGGVVSNWTVSDSLQSNFFGKTTAKVNLSGINQREWLIAPIFRVPQSSIMFFTAAVTIKDGTASATLGSDDKLEVLLSNDCGATWTTELTLNATSGLDNVLRQYAVRLDNYIGQEVIFAFKASDGPVNDPEDYDLHIANFESRFIYPNDAGIVSFRTDNNTTTIPANSGTSIYIRLKNFGSNPLSNIPILAKMGSVNYQYIQYQTMAPNQEIEINLGGYYGAITGPPQVPFKVFTMYPTDTINQNDTLNTMLNVTGAIGVGISDQVKELITVFPNPSESGLFIVETPLQNPGEYQVYDSKGVLIKTEIIESSSTSIDLKGFDKGVYFLKFKTASDQITKKLIYR